MTMSVHVMMSRREMVSFDAFLADDTIFDNKNPLLITI
jgi:hypothetical protein